MKQLVTTTVVSLISQSVHSAEDCISVNLSYAFSLVHAYFEQHLIEDWVARKAGIGCNQVAWTRGVNHTITQDRLLVSIHSKSLRYSCDESFCPH